MGYFRSPHTMNERRANQDPHARPKRYPKNLPNSYDDIHNASRQNRNWKRFRRMRYRS
jgi:hypothetical protein